MIKMGMVEVPTTTTNSQREVPISEDNECTLSQHTASQGNSLKFISTSKPSGQAQKLGLSPS